VRPVVVDPEYLAAGLLGRARPRRLLGLLAYGRWAQYPTLFGPAEEGLIQQEREGKIIRRGGPDAESLVRIAEHRRSLLSEALPYAAPDDLVLVASSAVHDAVVERVKLARKDEPAARAHSEIGASARRILASITPIMVGEIGGTYRSDEGLRDHLIELAAGASAPLVTDDPVLAKRDNAIWTHADRSGRPAFAVTSWTFVDRLVDRWPFSLEDVPYELLDIALRRTVKVDST
jgi:hypothetical protein